MVVFMLPFVAQATLNNGDFSSNTGTGNAAFNNGNVSDWEASHGSPSLGGGGPFFAWMWSYNGRGEGILADYDFEKGKCYEISYRIRVFDRGVDEIGTLATVNLVAASGMTGITSTGTTIPNPSSQENIHVNGFTNYPNNVWTNETVTFTPSSSASQLWIYPRYNGASINNGQAEMSITEIEIHEVTTILDPTFTYTRSCAPDGTISVEVNANGTGGWHWYALFETTTAGVTSGGVLSQGPKTIISNTHTFTGLCRDKFYYIKHGMYGSCAPWVEQRQALPIGDVLWTPRTADFSFDSLSFNGMNMSMTVSAATNGVQVSHWWAVMDAEPNCSVSGNTMVSGVQWGSSATFNNLQVNHCYYIKHGIWNCCAGWIEVRKYFKVVMKMSSPIDPTDEDPLAEIEEVEPTYEIIEGELEYIKLSEDEIQEIESAIIEYPFYPEVSVVEDEISSGVSQMSLVSPVESVDADLLITVYPNPVSTDQAINISSDALDIEEVQLSNFYGKTEAIDFQKSGEGMVSIVPKDKLDVGIYLLKMKMNDNSTVTRSVIIK